MSTGTAFVLASGSPRRRLLLSAAGFDFSVAIPEVDETPLEAEDPAEMVLRLSLAKALAVNSQGTVVLAADTIVVRDGTVLGKPTDSDDAVSMLQSLQGRAHSVLTGWTVTNGSLEQFGVVESRVEFAARTREELIGYVERTDPLDKAGAYALQGDDGWLVTEVRGSRANVMGLPLAEIVPALAGFGIERSTANR
jgi:septum formation protein